MVDPEERAGVRVLRATVLIVAALAVTSVVLWPVAVLALPLLFWAACGGRIARWSASLVATVVVFVAAEVAVWSVVRGVTGAPPRGGGWPVATGIVVAPLALVAFVRGARRVRARRMTALAPTSGASAPA